MSSPYPEVTVVNLPSSFMIVSSFTPSYSLLAYLFQFLGTVIFHLFIKINKYIYYFSSTFYTKMLSLIKKIFSSFKSLDYKLRGRYLNISISLRWKKISFSYSCHHYHLS
uniref:hypothetical protein n=1 Tax=Pleurocordyceps sinensis TaxID=99896 RepID=UPI00220E0438|nr:hypothetical protein OOD12_mgp22 [Pleurocordyceps sinensis]UXR11745.1 hypothetical protein [Pleurocordyceps sinensis]